MIPYLTLCLFCGLRRSEASAVTWGEVDFESGFVEVKAEKSKTRQRRIVTIPENARAWLRLGGDLPAININRRWPKILNAAGLQDWNKNAMRHSFCSYHLAFHGSAAKTALEAGHSETMLFQHYRELVKADQAREYWSTKPESKHLSA